MFMAFNDYDGMAWRWHGIVATPGGVFIENYHVATLLRKNLRYWCSRPR